MLSPPIESLLAEARAEELHRAARASNRRGAVVTPSSDLNRREASAFAAFVKRTMGHQGRNGSPVGNATPKQSSSPVPASADRG
jgi:hypothetical protein